MNTTISFKRELIIRRAVYKVICMCSVLFWFFQIQAQPGVNPNGYNQFFYPNGVLSSEGNLVYGKPDGYWKTYFETGALKSEGNRKHFELDSVWTFYREDGLLESRITYSGGVKQGLEQLYSKEGNRIEEYTYVNNKREGTARFYYESGELYREVQFVNNKESGKGYEYATDGRIITFLNYDDGFIRSIEKVNRMNKMGQRTGYWIEFWPNGNTREEGIWSNGVRNGIFKFYTKKGELDRIEVYRGGELVEDAEETIMLDIRKEYYENGKLKMVGSYKNGTKQGVFREYDQSGEIINSYVYEGNVKTGEGVVDPAGDYQGSWKLYYPTGEIRAEGSFLNGLKEGEWTYYFVTGKKEQTGNYKNGLPHGPWNWFYENGALLREERFRKGKEDGLMVEYDDQGNEIIKGEFIDGLKTGPWIYTVNDHKEEGSYLDGEKNGEWVHTYDNGEIQFKGEFLAGIPVGKHVWKYRNGTIKQEGKYNSGERHGNWDFSDESGLETYSVKYRYGEEIKINGSKVPESKGSDDDVN